MQVKLSEGLCASTVYELSIRDDGLHLASAAGREICIPFRQLRHVGLEGAENKRKQLRLETNPTTYEGVFFSDEDAAEFLSRLRQYRGFYVDIRLDTL